MSTFLRKIRHSCSIQSGLIAGLCLVFYWLGPISTWETNDDVYYNLLFSGQLLTSSPEPHVVYVSFVLSSLFTQLFTLAPGIPWYGYFHVTAIVLSIWFLNYCYVLVCGNDKLLLRIVLSLTSALPLLFFLQFTKTAAMLAVAGYLGLYLLNQDNFPSQRKSLLMHIGAVSLLVLSFSLRRDSFFLMTLLCGALMAMVFFKRKKTLIVALSMTIALIISVTLVHKINYGEEWKDFFALGRAIGPIIDFNQYLYEENQQVYTAAGLSRNDYYFLKSWGYADSQVYSPARFDSILANATSAEQKRDPLAALQVAVSFPARNYILTAVGLSLWLLLACHQRYRLLSLCIFLPFLACTVLLAWQGRFPPRVSTATVLFLPWAMLVLSGEVRKRWSASVVVIAVLTALLLPVYWQYRDISNIANYRQVQNQDLRRLGTELSSAPVVFVTLGASFPYEGLLPFDSPSYLAGARIVWLCGMNQTPVQKKQLAQIGITDLFASLSAGTIYIVMNPGERGILQQYIYEHYRKIVNVSPVFTGKTFTVYRLVAASV